MPAARLLHIEPRIQYKRHPLFPPHNHLQTKKNRKVLYQPVSLPVNQSHDSTSTPRLRHCYGPTSPASRGTTTKSGANLRGHVAKHGRPHGSDIGRSDGRGNVIVSRRDVCGEGSQGVEWGLVAPVQLVSHVLRNLVEGHMAWTFVHHLLGCVSAPSARGGGRPRLRLRLQAGSASHLLDTKRWRR